MTDTVPSDACQVAEAVEKLVALIRLAPSDVLERIAHGDSYANADDDEKHFCALNEVVYVLDCRLDRQPDNFWYPREPIELVSYGVGGHDIVTVSVANALLMISDLETDKYGYMSYRWEDSPGRAFFEDLPDYLKAPLLAGFDVLRARWKLEGR